ncbi:MAG: lysophospholipid acyltransferase family protein [Planctomycetota bacterium]|jgi:1-acyl-sn-glycerol-3-phosphate acyltransferase|nr:lysophospholipid acyltransferase family protein [Planctomycetota bacterium]MDP7129441.1 lysophospholipid acyltransferase family protein [Planctomycetota bacterium]MDP7253617.1 lysophospholipid acyltransferase family protein [Planctomycetota bacterium]
MSEAETVPEEDGQSSEQSLELRRSSPVYFRCSDDTFFAYEVHRFVAHILFGKMLFRIRHYGVENIPAEGGVVFASNHQCFFDPLLVGMGSKRQLIFMARASALKIPIIGKWIAAMNAFPVERGTADIGAIRRAVEAVSDGRILLMFPEGTRSQDGTIGVIRPGCILIAQKAESPIVPVAIRGAYEAWPRQNKLPRFGKVSIAYGPPIEPGRNREDAKQVQEFLTSEIHRLYQSLGWRYEA